MPLNEFGPHHHRTMREWNLARQENGEGVSAQGHKLRLDQFPSLVNHQPMAAAYVGAGGFHHLDLLLEPFRIADIIGIHSRYVFAPRSIDSLIQCTNKGLPLPLDDAYARVQSPMAFYDCERAVSGLVIDNQQFEVSERLAQDALDRFGKKSLAVVNGHYDRNQRAPSLCICTSHPAPPSFPVLVVKLRYPVRRSARSCVGSVRVQDGRGMLSKS